MSGRRSLTPNEERKLRRVVRQLPPRDRAFLTTLWLGGHRVSEVLSMQLGTIMRDGVLVSRIGIAPRYLKGHYGRTRWVPVLPELRRALESYLGWLRQRFELNPNLPLFISRVANTDGSPKALSRESARRILHEAFRRAGVENDGRLGTHTLRKSWAMRLLAVANPLIVSRALNHANLSTTQLYLDVDEAVVEAAIRRCDVSRRPRCQVQSKGEGVVLPFTATSGLPRLAQG